MSLPVLCRSTVLGVTAVALLATTSIGQQSAAELTFEKDIRPLFRAHCYDCHGATEEINGGLDLRLVRRMTRGGESGPAIAPGDANHSYLVQRLRDGEMPPGENRLAAREIAIIERWINLGAKTARPEPQTIGPGLGITLEERQFWAFQPVRRPRLPERVSSSGVRNPIDMLVLDGSPRDQATVSFAPEASRSSLIKRVHFGLTGLPPSPTAMKRWLAFDRDNWFEELVDELLASAHYGEHWARHWLDVAGYADSEGSTDADENRGWAWKYRDWVILSLNADKPVDQFIVEQIAGDELAGLTKGELDERQTELMTATGFLRMAADGTGSGANKPQNRNQVIADTLRIVSTSILGLSVHCSQCHDHRYDPIPQTDYYALRAVFEPALDWQAWKTPKQRLVSLYTETDREQAAEVEKQAQQVVAQMKAQESTYMAQALGTELDKYDDVLRAQLREAYETPKAKRTDEQKSLLFSHPKIQSLTTGSLYLYIMKWRKEKADWYERIEEARSKKPLEEFLRVLQEPPGHAPETRLFHRGDHEQPKQPITPAALTITAPSGQRQHFAKDDARLPTTGRRLAFARWLTNGRHPLVARVFVNRVWMHHFGRGIVNTPGDFGRFGARPTHPELLDWLADEFVRSGWSLKALQRLILTSATWRQQADVTAPEPSTGQSLARGTPSTLRPLIRLEAETLRDRMLSAAGTLEAKLFGAPDEVTEDRGGQVIVDGGQTRRSLYVRVRRSQPLDMLQAFDAPVMEVNCECRSVSTVSTQALMLMNGDFALQQAVALAQRVERELQPNGTAGDQIQRAWELALCREPTAKEAHLATQFLAKQVNYLDEHPEQLPKDVTAAAQALTNLCQTLMSSNEFLYLE